MPFAGGNYGLVKFFASFVNGQNRTDTENVDKIAKIKMHHNLDCILYLTSAVIHCNVAAVPKCDLQGDGETFRGVFSAAWLHLPYPTAI